MKIKVFVECHHPKCKSSLKTWASVYYYSEDDKYFDLWPELVDGWTKANNSYYSKYTKNSYYSKYTKYACPEHSDP